MAKRFQNKYTKLEQEVNARLRYLVNKRGKKSEVSSELSLKVKEDQMYNLDGGRYLVEITTDRLVDNSGYRYSFDCLSIEKLCEIADNI